MRRVVEASLRNVDLVKDSPIKMGRRSKKVWKTPMKKSLLKVVLLKFWLLIESNDYD